MAEHLLRIGELASQSGLTPDAVRYTSALGCCRVRALGFSNCKAEQRHGDARRHAGRPQQRPDIVSDPTGGCQTGALDLLHLLPRQVLIG